MRYSFLFAAVLILVSGFIAYFGDLLGRWMGKRRLTLLRLRPRHTAYAVTAVTGMLIATLTLATLISVNRDFNRLWNEGDRILAQNKALTWTNKLLHKQSKSLDARVKVLQDEVDQAEEDRLKAGDAALRAEEARKKAADAVKRLEKDIGARQHQIDVQEKQLAELKTIGESARAELEAKKTELNTRRAELTVAREQKKKAETSLKLASANLQQTEKEVREKQAALDEVTAALQLQHEALVKWGNRAMVYEQQATQLLGGDIRFRQGDEIFRGTISPRQSLFAIKGDLYSLLDAASGKAEKVGAGPGPSGRAIILPQYVVEDGKPSPVTESLWVEEIARAIAAGAFSSPDTLVRVVCIGNSLAGEPVPVRLVLHYNKLVYAKGDLIASTSMNGRLSEGRVLLSVVNFLQNEVSRAGLKAGIVPVSNPDPRASLGADARTQVEGLMSVVDQVKAQGTRVKVETYACADIFAIGPLSMTNMRFSVTKVE